MLVPLASSSGKQGVHPPGILWEGFLPCVGNAAGPFPPWSSLRLRSAETNSAQPLDGVPQGGGRQWGAVGAGRGGRHPDVHPGDSITALRLWLHHIISQKLSFLTRKMGIKVAPTSG